MATRTRLDRPDHTTPDCNPDPERRRSAWRQRLVEAERGMTHGLRGDSTLFVHFFVGSTIVATGFVLGLQATQWVLLILTLTLVLSAEMFNKVLKAVLEGVGHHFDDSAQRALRISTAAVFVTLTGAFLAIALIFGQRLAQLF